MVSPHWFGAGVHLVQPLRQTRLPQRARSAPPIRPRSACDRRAHRRAQSAEPDYRLGKRAGVALIDSHEIISWNEKLIRAGVRSVHKSRSNCGCGCATNPAHDLRFLISVSLFLEFHHIGKRPSECSDGLFLLAIHAFQTAWRILFSAFVRTNTPSNSLLRNTWHNKRIGRRLLNLLG